MSWTLSASFILRIAEQRKREVRILHVTILQDNMQQQRTQVSSSKRKRETKTDQSPCCNAQAMFV